MRIHWHPSVGDDVRQALLRHQNDPLALAGRTFRTNPRSSVGHAQLGDTAVIIKRFNTPTLLVRVKRILGPSLAWRAWRNAAVLQRLGIATPQPLARLESGRWRLRPVSVLVQEYAAGVAGDVYFADPTVPLEVRQRAAARLAEQVARLHAAGYIHGDLKPKNVLIDAGRPCLIDLDSMHRRRLRVNLTRGIDKDRRRLQEIFTRLQPPAGAAPAHSPSTVPGASSAQSATSAV